MKISPAASKGGWENCGWFSTHWPLQLLLLMLTEGCSRRRWSSEPRRTVAPLDISLFVLFSLVNHYWLLKKYRLIDRTVSPSRCGRQVQQRMMRTMTRPSRERIHVVVQWVVGRCFSPVWWRQCWCWCLHHSSRTLTRWSFRWSCLARPLSRCSRTPPRSREQCPDRAREVPNVVWHASRCPAGRRPVGNIRATCIRRWPSTSWFSCTAPHPHREVGGSKRWQGTASGLWVRWSTSPKV